MCLKIYLTKWFGASTTSPTANLLPTRIGVKTQGKVASARRSVYATQRNATKYDATRRKQTRRNASEVMMVTHTRVPEAKLSCKAK